MQTPRHGDYQAIRRIGSGGMGEVWLAHHVSTHGLAAVKVIRNAGTRSRERMARLFDRERRAIARLSHPNIVQLFEIGNDYLAMRFIDGANLARRMTTSLEPRDAIDIVLQIADALAHAHAQGVVHCDVKPSNILLDTVGNAYLADFGLAAILDEGDHDHGGGTPQYMAPEQARGQAGPAADQYSLGRVLVELLASGRVSSDPDEGIRALPATIPAPLASIVRRAIDLDPQKRWPSVAAFGAALVKVDASRSARGTMPLLPELRIKSPFGWVVNAERRSVIAPMIARADYRLSQCLDSEALARFRARTGYADFGWSVIGREDRLGALVEPAAYARTGEIVVMIHGGFCTREVWVDLATHVAQTNAQTLVLAPDVCGYGVSAFATTPPAREHLTAEATMDAVLAWLEAIGVRELPTVLAGHSLGAVVVMSAHDDALGPRTSRIAISPVFPAVDVSQRWGLRVIPRVLDAVSRLPGAKHLVGRAALSWSPMARAYSPIVRKLMLDAYMTLPSTTLARSTSELSRARPAPHAQMQRCVVVLSENDPIAPLDRMQRALKLLNFPDSNVYRMIANGHLPHGETVAHPEWTRRNIAELVALIDHMLVTAREGTVLPTRLASTLVTDGSSTTKN